MSNAAIKYNSGFGNEFSTEAVKGALPEGQNSPQKVPYDLYTELLTGSPFTMPRHTNKRSWQYRIQPSAVHPAYQAFKNKKFLSCPHADLPPTPANQFRWDPLEFPKKPTDFIEGITTIAVNGDLYSWIGMGVHIYAANKSMSENKRYFYNSDGELLIIPQQGRIIARTEFGVIEARPNEIIVIPRGVKFAVDLPDGQARGYICENYGHPFILPDLGPIGSNGLANPRDFQIPVAAYEDNIGSCEVITKFGGNLWHSEYTHSPLDVVAWHGNYTPYKYDLNRFNTMNTVSFDHPDPSIFTVLTSPSYPPGTANIDFVIFPPRWMVAEDTFRPPWFHRNVMSEFMGLIDGVYDGKTGGGFVPGGSSLHNCMVGHGPDAAAYQKAVKASQKPVYLKGSIAFMLESRHIMRPTKTALEGKWLQKDYYECWQGLEAQFKP